MATKGLLAKKIGMTQVFTEKGELLPVTVLEAGPCMVVGVRAIHKDGYGAVQLGFGPVKAKHVTKPQPGSIGSSSTPSRVYKGMRMAGQLGNAQRTTTHLKIVRVDVDRNLLLVNGDVPGHKNSVVLVRDSVRQPKGAK